MRLTTSQTCPHIRRHRVRAEADCWILDCDCGWRGRTPLAGQPRADADEILERLFIGHLRPDERRAYILCDVRRPDSWRSLAEIMEEAEAQDSPISLQEAKRIFHAQSPIIGNFVMPEGTPVLLLHSRYEDEIHYGTYRVPDTDEIDELPIGEVRTPEGRVFRAE